MTILLKEFLSTALSAQDGELLREKIQNILNNNPNEEIILDFQDIKLFATPFFNSSIGYFIMKLSPSVFDKHFNIKNISNLGNETFTLSYNTAKNLFQNNISEEQSNNMKNIIESNLEEN